MLWAFCAKGYFGHVQWHMLHLGTACLTDKAAEYRKAKKNEEAH